MPLVRNLIFVFVVYKMSEVIIAEINQLKEELRIVFEKIDMAQKLGRSGEDWLDRLSDERKQISRKQ